MSEKGNKYLDHLNHLKYSPKFRVKIILFLTHAMHSAFKIKLTFKLIYEYTIK